FFFHNFPLYLHQFLLMWKVGFRSRRQWNSLRNEIFLGTGLGIVIRPTRNRGNLTGPVAMSRLDRRGPLQRSRSPWILARPSAPIHAIEEVEYKDKLCKEGDDSRNGHEHVQVGELIGKVKVCEAIVPSRESCDADVMHGEEHQVNTHKRQPEVNVAQSIVHHSTEHLREPVIDSGNHTEEGRRSHYQVEVCHNKVGIVDLDIDGGVTHKDPRQAA